MIGSRVFQRIPRVARDLLSEVELFSVADLHEAMGPIDGRMQLMSARMRPVSTAIRAVGQAVTAYNYPGDNLMMHAALHVAERGDVLVLVNGGTPNGALFGDVAAKAASLKGISGVVVDGPVRDTRTLRDMGFPTWSTFISVSHPAKRGPGSVNVPVVCDGVRVQPGDVIVADEDGVLIIPLGWVRPVIARARARAEGETKMRQRLNAGESLFDILGTRAMLDAAGVEFHDIEWDSKRDLKDDTLA